MHLLLLIRNQYFIKEYLYETLSYTQNQAMQWFTEANNMYVLALCHILHTHTPIYIFVFVNICIFVLSCSVVSDSLKLHGL